MVLNTRSLPMDTSECYCEYINIVVNFTYTTVTNNLYIELCVNVIMCFVMTEEALIKEYQDDKEVIDIGMTYTKPGIVKYTNVVINRDKKKELEQAARHRTCKF